MSSQIGGSKSGKALHGGSGYSASKASFISSNSGIAPLKIASKLSSI